MVCIFFTPFGMHPFAMQRLFNLSPVVDFFLASYLCSVFFLDCRNSVVCGTEFLFSRISFGAFFFFFFSFFCHPPFFYFRILERFFRFVAAAHPSSPSAHRSTERKETIPHPRWQQATSS